jgi:hypothetical protein
MRVNENVPKEAVMAVLDEIDRLEYAGPGIKLAWPSLLLIRGKLRASIGLSEWPEGAEEERREAISLNWLFERQEVARKMGAVPRSPLIVVKDDDGTLKLVAKSSHK